MSSPDRPAPPRPPPAVCACGAAVEPSFMEAPSFSPTAGWWFLGEVCDTCRATATAAAHASAVEGAQARAAIPVRYRGMRFGAHRKQAEGETFATFREAVARAGIVGITAWNVAAARTLRSWPSETGTVIVSGPVGAGKTALAYAALNTQIDRNPDVEARAIVEGDLLALAGPKCRDTLRALSRKRFLLIDDLGATERLSPGQKDAVETIILARYDAQAPTLITSNLRLTGMDRRTLSTLYGERVGSRLLEMVGGPERDFPGYVELRGMDWRSGQPHGDAPAPVPQPSRRSAATPTRPDHKRRAAGDNDD